MTFKVMTTDEKNEERQVLGTLWASEENSARVMASALWGSEAESRLMIRKADEDRELPLNLPN